MRKIIAQKKNLKAKGKKVPTFRIGPISSKCVFAFLNSKYLNYSAIKRRSLGPYID